MATYEFVGVTETGTVDLFFSGSQTTGFTTHASAQPGDLLSVFVSYETGSHSGPQVTIDGTGWNATIENSHAYGGSNPDDAVNAVAVFQKFIEVGDPSGYTITFTPDVAIGPGHAWALVHRNLTDYSVTGVDGGVDQISGTSYVGGPTSASNGASDLPQLVLYFFGVSIQAGFSGEISDISVDAAITLRVSGAFGDHNNVRIGDRLHEESGGHPELDMTLTSTAGGGFAFHTAGAVLMLRPNAEQGITGVWEDSWQWI